MEIPGILSSMAEGSITLAGFAAVFRAFKGKNDPDGYSWIRLAIVIEGGLIVAFGCYLPIFLSSTGLGADQSWRIASALILVWLIPRQNFPTIRILVRGRPFPELYWLAGPLGVLATILAIANAIGISPFGFYSTHLLIVLLILGNVGTIFVAQFRVEHSLDEP